MTTTCLAHWIPTSGQLPNKGDRGFTKGMPYKSKSRREGKRKEPMFADFTFCQEQSIVPEALGTSSPFILITILIR